MASRLRNFTQMITSFTSIMFMAGAMAALLLVTYTEGAIALRRRAGRISRLRATVLARLAADVDIITAADLGQFRNAHGLDETTAKPVLDSIYAELPSKDTTPEHLAGLRSLLDDIETNEPRGHLPIEVRPSLVRIQGILADSADRRDSAVLAPVLRIERKRGSREREETSEHPQEHRLPHWRRQPRRRWRLVVPHAFGGTSGSRHRGGDLRPGHRHGVEDSSTR